MSLLLVLLGMLETTLRTRVNIRLTYYRLCNKNNNVSGQSIDISALSENRVLDENFDSYTY